MNNDRIGTIDHLCRNFPDLAKKLRQCDQWIRAAHRQGDTGRAGQFRAWKSNGITLLSTDYHLEVRLIDSATEEGGPEYLLFADQWNNQWDDPLRPRPISDGEWGAGALPEWVIRNNTPEGPRPVHSQRLGTIPGV